MKSTVIFFALILSVAVYSQSLKNGVWRGVIEYEQIEVPFLFEVAPSGGDVPEITFVNGLERRTVINARIEGDTILIPLDPFDVVIKAGFTAMSMEGAYIKYYRNKEIPFRASYGNIRFPKRNPARTAIIEDRWKFTFSPDSPSMSVGVGLFKQTGDRVTGTIMTETSDYRYFDGIIDGDSLKLSSFDGAHAFMIIGKRTEGKLWEGAIVFDDNYSEPWLATYDKEAEIDDPFNVVTLEPGKHKPYYDLLGAGSGRDVIDPSVYEGKVLLIQVFGTWCPNSHDQTRYLVDWFSNNKDRGIAILASSYEANYSQEYGLKRLESYREDNEIPYDLVLGGRLSKAGAATPFPFIDRLKAFPTLIIVDKKGYARYVHSYFNGPATGAYYEAFDKRLNQIVDQLLSE